MRTNLAPPRQDLAGFVRWPESSPEDSTITITDGSWLGFIPVAIFVMCGLFCVVLPILALTMPVPPKPIQLPGPLELGEYLLMWLLGALLLYAARVVFSWAQPSRLSLDLAGRSYTLREGFRRRERVWAGTFDDIREIYVWKRRPRGSDQYMHNVIISWKMRGVSTRLWTYNSKSADDPKPETWAKGFCQELGVPFGGVLVGDIIRKWERE